MTTATMPSLSYMISTLKGWDLTLAKERVLKEQAWSPDFVNLLEREYKRFIALCVLTQASLGMRGMVDEMWHAHILFTMDYARFCNTIAGEFLHHAPLMQQEVKDSPQTFRDVTKPLYERYFGEMPNIWLQNSADCTQDKCGNACEKCGSQCRMATDMKDDGSLLTSKTSQLQAEFAQLTVEEQRKLLSQLT